MISIFLSHPLTSLLVTLSGFAFFKWLQDKSNGNSLLNPVVWAIVICVIFIKISGIDYATYMEGVSIIHFLLGPVTVALAVPLYRLIIVIRKDALAMRCAIGVSCIIAAFSAMFIAYMMDASQDIQLAITSKSVTAPIAIEIANKINTPESLAIFFVFTTGIPGSLLATFIFKMMNVKDERTQGLALGTTCHGLGTARAFQISETAGTYAIIGMSIMGILSGLCLPAIILYLL